MDLTKERILVTGAGGFVGASLVRRLLGQGVRPHVILRANTNIWRIADIKNKMSVHEGDITDAVSIQRIIEDVRPTIIYHLAAHGAYPTQTDAGRIMTVNVMGTLHLLKALEKVEYKLFVNTGSSSEYGFKDKPMRETDVLVPNSFYAAAKAAQTLLCQYTALRQTQGGAASQKKNIVTLRLFAVYGPYEEPARLVPTIIRSCLQGKDLTMVRPQIARDFIFVDDVVDAYLNAEALMKHGGEIFNIGAGVEVTLKQITGALLNLTGALVRVHWGAMPDRIWDSPTWVGDVGKAKALLGFTARTPLEQGLEKTITWVRQHG